VEIEDRALPAAGAATTREQDTSVAAAAGAGPCYDVRFVMPLLYAKRLNG